MSDPVELVHHKSFNRKPRAPKYQQTQASANSTVRIVPFSAQFKPNYLHLVFDLETTGLVSPEVEIVNIAVRVDELLLRQLLKTDPNTCCSCDKVICSKNEDCEEEKKKSHCKDFCHPFRCHYSPLQCFESLVKPCQTISEEVIAIHHITNEDVAKAPTIKPVLQACMQFISQQRQQYKLPDAFPILFTAHNTFQFDQLVLQKELVNCKVPLPYNVFFGDTRHTLIHSIGGKFYPEQGQRSSLQVLVKQYCNMPSFEQSHSAIADVDALLQFLHQFPDREMYYEFLYQDRASCLTHPELIKCLEKKKVNYNNNNNNNTNNNTSNQKRQFTTFTHTNKNYSHSTQTKKSKFFKK